MGRNLLNQAEPISERYRNDQGKNSALQRNDERERKGAFTEYCPMLIFRCFLRRCIVFS